LARAAIEGATELERLVARSRLIGVDRSLVLHGGGNTSTKTVELDHLGRERRVLRIKGSGADLATCGRRDFPGLWLDELLPLRERDAMSDDEMVAHLVRCLVEPDSPRPSIETLLHAFLPAAHVDHVHADAICALANAPDPAAAVRDALGEEVAVVSYLRPGFELAKRVADLAGARAVVLIHHGLVTWGETHEDSYALTLELVDRAVAFLGDPPFSRDDGDVTVQLHHLESGAEQGIRGDVAVPLHHRSLEEPGRTLARLRGRLSGERRQVLALDRRRRAIADREDVDAIAAMRSTPDHMFRIGARTAVMHGSPGDVDPDARIVLVPGLGCVAAAPDAGTARVRLEVAAHSHAATAATHDRFGGASWLSEQEIEAFVDWPLELYKLTLAPPPLELEGHVAVVTGAASGIGRAVADDLAARGAAVVTADLADADVVGDLTDPGVVDELVGATVERHGGLDAVILCAGVAATGRLADVTEAEWRRSLEVNLTSHFLLTKRVWPLLVEQGLGGSLVYVASKNAFAPGAGFGPYSVAKAGLVQLAKIAALEGGPHGIRANVVNPDAVFGGSRLWSDEVRRERAAAHGIPLDELEAFYAKRSLLGREVTAADVAEAVAFLVSDRSAATTGCTITVDGGVPAAFPR